MWSYSRKAIKVKKRDKKISSKFVSLFKKNKNKSTIRGEERTKSRAASVAWCPVSIKGRCTKSVGINQLRNKSINGDTTPLMMPSSSYDSYRNRSCHNEVSNFGLDIKILKQKRSLTWGLLYAGVQTCNYCWITLSQRNLKQTIRIHIVDKWFLVWLSRRLILNVEFK